MTIPPLFRPRSLLPLLLLVGASVPGPAQSCGWAPDFPSFGPSDPVHAFVEFDDGSGPALYAAGRYRAIDDLVANRIAKWDGTSWSALGNGLPHNNPSDIGVEALAVFDDGTGAALYAAGAIHVPGGGLYDVVKWDGSVWQPLGLGFNLWASALAVFDDGNGAQLYVGGRFSAVEGIPLRGIARWDGVNWSAAVAGVNADGYVSTLAVYDDGSGPALFAGGGFSSIGGISASRIAKWDGTSWSPVGGGLSSTCLALHVHDDGTGAKLYAGGKFTVAGGAPANRVACWNGTSWTALGGGLDGDVEVISSYDDGSGSKLYVGGEFANAGGVAAGGIASWSGSSWSAVGGWAASSARIALMPFDDGSGAKLYVGGSFGGHSAPSSFLASWDGTSWSGVSATPPTTGGTQGAVIALESLDEGAGAALYVAGAFSHAGGLPARNVARWDGTAWSPLGSGTEFSANALAIYDEGSGPRLFAGVGSESGPGIERWDGSTWSTPGGGTDGFVFVLQVFDDGTGPMLYAGGEFTSAGGGPASNIARWDGSNWSSVGTGTNDVVYALAVFDDGTGPALYAGGLFTMAGGMAASRIARWDGTSWSPVGGGCDGTVIDLRPHHGASGPVLYAAGGFTSAGGVAAGRVAKWDGANWSSLGSGVNANVLGMTVLDVGSGPFLYVSGFFNQAGGTPANRVAAWDGINWSPLTTGFDDVPFCSTSFDDGNGPAVYFGGIFEVAGGLSSRAIAKWVPCSSPVVSFCPGDGTVGACPCANLGATGSGCDNSANTGGARLTANGSTVPDSLVLQQTGELPTSLSIFLQGSVELATPAPFGDGLRCAGGSLKRLYVKNAVGGAVDAPQTGDPSITSRSAALGDPIPAGATRVYQVYYRDPALAFCASPQGDAFNVGNALRVVW